MVVRKDWHKVEWFMPISSSVCVESSNKNVGSKDFIIKGVAITEEITRNNIRYVAKELEKAAPSFRNKPILLDHRNEVRAIVGRTTKNVVFNSSLKAIEFEAKIMDEVIQGMISDGRISNVSIGAKVEDLQKGEDGIVVAIGIEGLEISLVAVPGSANATIDFAQGLANSLIMKESMEAKYLEPDNVMKVEDVEFEDIKKEEEKVISKDKLFRYHCNKCGEGWTTTIMDIDKCPKCRSKDIEKVEVDLKGKPMKSGPNMGQESYDEWLQGEYLKDAEKLLSSNKCLILEV